VLVLFLVSVCECVVVDGGVGGGGRDMLLGGVL
jgi:hypothetical protein